MEITALRVVVTGDRALAKRPTFARPARRVWHANSEPIDGLLGRGNRYRCHSTAAPM